MPSTLVRTWRSAWERTITGSMTCPETRSRPRWSVSWAAAGSLRTLAAAVLLCAVACSSPDLPAIATPSPSATVDQSPSPSPNSTSDQTPVAQRVLPPATDPPVANLCSKPITTTSDQNAVPLFCTNGAVNVLAWAFYGAVGASILGLGLN